MLSTRTFVLLGAAIVAKAADAGDYGDFSTYPQVPKTASINGFADPIYSAVPQCAQNCLDETKDTSNTPCPYWDTGCLCVMSNWGGALAQCVAENCEGQNVQVFTSAASSKCSEVGAPSPYWFLPDSAKTSLAEAANKADEATTTSEAGKATTTSEEGQATTSTPVTTTAPETTAAPTSTTTPAAAASSKAPDAPAASSAAQGGSGDAQANESSDAAASAPAAESVAQSAAPVEQASSSSAQAAESSAASAPTVQVNGAANVAGPISLFVAAVGFVALI